MTPNVLEALMNVTAIANKRKKEKTEEDKNGCQYNWIFLSNVLMKFYWKQPTTQPAITCSKLTKETLKQRVKYVQS